DVHEQLGADHRLTLRQRARDRVERRWQRLTVACADTDAGEMRGERPAEIAIGPEHVDRGGIGELDHAVGTDDEHRFHERIEDGPEDALGFRRSAGFRSHLAFLSGVAAEDTTPGDGAPSARSRSSASRASEASSTSAARTKTTRPIGSA